MSKQNVNQKNMCWVIGNRANRLHFLLSCLFVLSYREHDSIDCGPDFEQADRLIPFIRKAFKNKRYFKNKSQMNATRAIVRLLDKLKPGLPDQIAARTVKLIGGQWQARNFQGICIKRN